MSVVGLLPALIACCMESATVSDYYIIAAVSRRVEDGFVLPHKENGDPRCKAA
jgi:hypothetical protein